MMLPRPAATMVSPKTWQGSRAPPTRFRSKTPCHPARGSLQKSPPGRQGGLRLVAARSVDQDADPTPALDDGIPGPGQGVAVQGVGGLEHGAAALRLDVPDALQPAFRIAANNGDVRSGAGQRIGHGAAKNPGAADDDGGFVFEIEQVVCHGVCFPY